MRREVIPKNILMIGPTGVGKTEIARRLATLAGAPFVKVEATKYTEVGYVGRDVESMVRDLAEAAIRMVKDERRGDVQGGGRTRRGRAHHRRAASRDARAAAAVSAIRSPRRSGSIFGNSFGAQANQPQQPPQPAPPPRRRTSRSGSATTARADIERGFYDVRLIEIEVEETPQLADRDDGRRRARRWAVRAT